jgi:hypothetical protein
VLKPRRSIAIDWSGALTRATRKICLAEARGGRLLRVEDGRDRDQVVRHLSDEAQRDPHLAVGLDFAFGFPAWFPRAHGLDSIEETWALTAREGEVWLRDCPYPFWGRPGSPCPAFPQGRSAFRKTESEAPPLEGIHPKSVFQVGGAGTVGTGSLRGMPHLPALRDAGFAVLPFDAPRGPLVFEIWPRLLTGRVNKSDGVTRWTWLQVRFPDQDPELLRRAARTEDSFDAAVSALMMDRFLHRHDTLPIARDDVDRIEGRIWRPLLDPCVHDARFALVPSNPPQMSLRSPKS